MTTRRWIPLACVLVAATLGGGCAAVSNPVSDGIPVRYLPKEVLGRPKKELVPVPLTLLRIKEADNYKLDKGDILAVIAGDMFGPENIQPPVSIPNPGEGTLSAVGYPVPVREDGTISLPSARYKPISVKGMTAVEVEQKLRRVLIDGEDNMKEDGTPLQLYNSGSKISVQLQKKRRYNVTVVRDDVQSNQQIGAGGILLNNTRRSGVVVSLEAGKNDVLNALSQSGGPPGSDARDEVIIERGQYDMNNPRKIFTTIPLTIYPDQPLTLTEKDVTLNDGDILRVPNRATDHYMVGGIINPKQVALPKDYDLDVVQAVIVANGPIANGAFSQNQFTPGQVADGLGSPSPSLINVLRQMPDGQQINIRVDLARALRDPRENILILPDDRIIMQEKPAESLARYITQKFFFTFNLDFANPANNMANFFTTGLPGR